MNNEDRKQMPDPGVTLTGIEDWVRYDEEPEVENPGTFVASLTYEPWFTERCVGYRVRLPSGSYWYVYLSPTMCDEEPEAEPTVFAYEGWTGYPTMDKPITDISTARGGVETWARRQLSLGKGQRARMAKSPAAREASRSAHPSNGGA